MDRPAPRQMTQSPGSGCGNAPAATSRAVYARGLDRHASPGGRLEGTSEG